MSESEDLYRFLYEDRKKIEELTAEVRKLTKRLTWERASVYQLTAAFLGHGATNEQVNRMGNLLEQMGLIIEGC